MLNEAEAAAAEMVKNGPGNLYAQRCLALASRALGDYHARLARRGPVADRGFRRDQAAHRYREALSIWSRWRKANLGVPYSVNREREVLALLKGLH
jgi:hypothetical protein